MTGSLAFRRNEADIIAGLVPEKYTRLLPYIHGGRVLEIGSAEGVLALLLARNGERVTALEANPERHASALNLATVWTGKFRFSGSAMFINGKVQDALDLLQPDLFDTLVAVRMIYYLRDDLDAVFAAVGKRIPNVVLCGNKNRAAEWRQGIPDKPGGPVQYYASHEGMRALLERHGYTITAEETEGDPIVVGRKDV